MYRLSVAVATGFVFLTAATSSAVAATLCVNPKGIGGCYSSISAAVAAAAPHDVILVDQGTYAEQVTIAKPLSLVGHNRENTSIDASGLSYGINIDGFHHSGLGDVLVSGFTIQNANFEGILITNASDITIADNELVNNNLSLDFAGATCPGLLPPDSQQGEGFDCGEGIHLSGVNHSTIASNIVHHNAGGILLSDDSGPTHDNLVMNNTVTDNVFDCGVTLASHVPVFVAPNGVFHNTISGNDVSGNGTLGQGAGVGLFTPAPGTATYGNVVVGNRAVGNGLPGVSMHSHAPNQNLNDNHIVGNYLADNGVDDDAQTPGTTGIVVFGVSPVTGTVISGNIIEREDVAVAVKTGSTVDVHLNNFNNHNVGVANIGTGSVDAIANWWGCAQGPGAPGCSGASGSVTTDPALRRPIEPQQK